MRLLAYPDSAFGKRRERVVFASHLYNGPKMTKADSLRKIFLIILKKSSSLGFFYVPIKVAEKVFKNYCVRLSALSKNAPLYK